MGVAGALIFVLSGCGGLSINTQTSSQLNSIGDVQLATTYCTTANDGDTACAAVAKTKGQATVAKLGYVIPQAANAPASFGSVSGRALNFSQDSSYTPSQAGVTVPSGSKWVGYSSGTYTYDGAAETVKVRPQFSLSRGFDGSPYSGGFNYSVTVQQYASNALTKPSTKTGNQATRDLGVKDTDASVSAGKTASVTFDLKYAGASGAGPFTVAASTDVPGATATPSVTTLSPAADSDNNVSAGVPVSATTAPGSYQVTVTASLANGQTRTGTANLTVTPKVPTVKQVAAGFDHSCVILYDNSVNCWGSNYVGQLGQGNTTEYGGSPSAPISSEPPVNLGSGRTALQISAGYSHTCALLDTHQVLCWGAGGGGDLGQGDQRDIGDDETPASVPPVDLGGHTATAISAGAGHTCAILDNGNVKCWGGGQHGQLGYANTATEPNVIDLNSVGTVDIGNRTAVAIDAAADHTCIIANDGGVMCWGGNTAGKLGYGYNETQNQNIGDDETPASVGEVDLGGHTAIQITGGDNHTCALLENHTVDCWGTPYRGISGDPSGLQHFSPSGPIDFGNHTVLQIEAAADHTCAVLDDQSVRCWGFGDDGRLGYGNTNDIGDNETPGSAGPVNLGAGRTASQVSAGRWHSCALLDIGDVRCWGLGMFLGYGNQVNIGDDETPDTAGPIDFGQ